MDGCCPVRDGRDHSPVPAGRAFGWRSSWPGRRARSWLESSPATARSIASRCSRRPRCRDRARQFSRWLMPCSTRIRCAEHGVRPGAPRRRRADRQLVPPPGRPRSDDRTSGLGAQALIAGVGQQGDPRDEGQQLDQAGLADLGQIVDRAWEGLPAEQQAPAGIGDHQRLDRVRPGLARDEPADRPGQRPGGAPAPPWHPAGRHARWRPGGPPHRPVCAAELHPPRCSRARPAAGAPPRLPG